MKLQGFGVDVYALLMRWVVWWFQKRKTGRVYAMVPAVVLLKEATMLPFLLAVFVLILLVSLASGYYVLKARTLEKSVGVKNLAARKSLKNVGLAIMAAPGILILAYTIFATVASGRFLGYTMLVYALPFLAAFILTMWRPLLGASISLGVALLLIVPAVGLIVFNYEMSAFFGIVLLLLSLVWLTGARSVLSSLRKTSTNSNDPAGR